MDIQKTGGSTTANGRSQAIFEELRNRICFLIYPPGTRLGEIELANEFGVSRTPIRRVLAGLEMRGLVQAQHGVGTIVTEIQDKTLFQTYELRKELSLLLARLSPTADSQKIATAVKPLIAKLLALPDEPCVTDYARINAAFFQELLQITDNEPLKEICENLYFLTSRIWVHSIPQSSLREEVRVFHREMEEVLDALLSGDIQAVGYIRWMHINLSYKRLRSRNTTAQQED
ncbi:GntR family transcriptional regulator [Kiloniella laminariae]|uniref:GntR family transcriptional regulator n=1 Tax=Kiloniella laminariae TaxID=454162 RepID=UPI00037C5C5D|nr:GntR family transcriptional regulator [Kiloniella laminariae]